MSIFITIEQCEKKNFIAKILKVGRKGKRAETIPDIVHKIYHQQRKLTKSTWKIKSFILG